MSQHPLIRILQECLRQELNLVSSLNDSDYQGIGKKPYKSSVGMHIRHNLDHFSAFFSGIEQGRIDYESRQRNQIVESSTTYTCELITDYIEKLNDLSVDEHERLYIRQEDGLPLATASWIQSSAARELQFLLGHTVHHHAIIAMLLNQRGVETPEGFGVAPSTQRHEQRESLSAGQ